MGHGAEAKHKARTMVSSSITIFIVALLVLLYGWQALAHFGSRNAAADYLPANVLRPLHLAGYQQQQQSSSSSSSSVEPGSSSSSSGLSLPASTLKYFPQAARCSTGWMQQFAQLQSDILAGKRPPRHFVSVAVEAGLADRLTGLITHFWHAVLTQRAFSTVAYGDLPSFKAMCDAPFIDWTTRPAAVPDEAVEPLKFTYKGVRGYPGNQRYLPETMDAAMYQMLYLVNGPSRNLTIYQNANLSSLLTPDPAYLMAASNRGRTWALGNNPFHKRQFWDWGVPPSDIFMCGFFFMCNPVAAIQQYYQKYWDALQEPGVLKIGIQIRLGDGVFKKQETEQAVAETVKVGAEWFECAERLEKAFAAPGQKVVWYLNSDSQQLRKAAKTVYGAKLITDDELKMTHPDCFQDKSPGAGAGNKSSSSGASAGCQQALMDEALQHSLGAMLTFSMTDYHIISKASGFGRLGAWLSGRWGNIYQVVKGQGACNPTGFVPPEQSAFHYSGV